MAIYLKTQARSLEARTEARATNNQSCFYPIAVHKWKIFGGGESRFQLVASGGRCKGLLRLILLSFYFIS